MFEEIATACLNNLLKNPTMDAVTARIYQATRGGDRRSEEIKVSADTLKTAEDRAAQAGVSIATQKRADKVAKADPELAKQVAHGEISLPKAVEQVSPKKPKPEPVPNGEGMQDDAPDIDPIELMEELQAAAMTAT